MVFGCVLAALGDACFAAVSCACVESEAGLLVLAADAAVGAVKEARGGLTSLLLVGEECALGAAPGLVAVDGVFTVDGELAFADFGPAEDAGLEVEV